MAPADKRASEAEIKIERYNSEVERIISDVMRFISRRGIYVDDMDVHWTLQELRPDRGEIGSKFEMRDYNLSKKDYLSVWEYFRNITNFDPKKEALIEKISFDPPDAEEIGKYFVNATLEINGLCKRFIDRNGFDPEIIREDS